jgi:hypothetical protein
MKNINWNDYDNSSLEFVFEQSNKLHEDTFKSFRESCSRSFTIVSIFGGMVAYCFSKTINDAPSLTNIPYYVMGIGLIICIYVLWKNLMPGRMVASGTKPSCFLNEYFSHPEFKEDRKREMLIVRIEDLEKSININLTQATKRARRFTKSSYLFLFFLLFSVTVSIVC